MKRTLSWLASLTLCSVGLVIVIDKHYDCGLFSTWTIQLAPIIMVLLLISFSFFAYYDSL